MALGSQIYTYYAHRQLVSKEGPLRATKSSDNPNVSKYKFMITVCLRTHIHTYACINRHIHTHMHACIQTCMHTYMHMYIHINMYLLKHAQSETQQAIVS